MKQEVFSLGAFPVAVYKTENFLTEQEKQYIINCDYHEINESGTNYITNNSFILADEQLNSVRNKCYKFLNSYTTEILKIRNEFKITNSWAVKSFYGGYHHPHAHPNSIFSCVYYVQADSADVIFKFDSSYSKHHQFQYDIIEDNCFNSGSYTVSPRTGDLLIFPSWIFHGVTENLSQSERVVLAFNSFVSGMMGSTIRNTSLNIGVNI